MKTLNSRLKIRILLLLALTLSGLVMVKRVNAIPDCKPYEQTSCYINQDGFTYPCAIIEEKSVAICCNANPIEGKGKVSYEGGVQNLEVSCLKDEISVATCVEKLGSDYKRRKNDCNEQYPKVWSDNSCSCIRPPNQPPSNGDGQPPPGEETGGQGSGQGTTQTSPCTPPDNALGIDFDCITESQGLEDLTSIGGILGKFVPLFFTLSGLILFVYLIWAGFSYLTSGGDPQKVEGARGHITNALIGFIIIFVSFWLIQIMKFIFGLGEVTLFN